MLDVEFLLERPSFDRPLIYIYRSGALCAPMKVRLEEISSGLGLQLCGCDPEKLATTLRGMSLWPAFNICEWSRDTKEANEVAESTLEIFASHNRGDCALFVPAGSILTEKPNWPKTKAASVVIEEPMLTPDTLPPVLRYLEATTDLANQPCFLSQPAFVESFDDLLEERNASLFDAMRAFDYLVVTQADPKTNKFNFRLDRTEQSSRGGRSSLLRQLRQIVDGRHPRDLPQFIASLEDRYLSDVNAQAMVADMYRMTDTLLSSPGNASRRGDIMKAKTGVAVREDFGVGAPLWAALLLLWEDRLVERTRGLDLRRRHGSDMTIVNWERMARDFLARAERAKAEDPLAGLWTTLRQTQQDESTMPPGRLAHNRANMKQSLAQYLETIPKRRRTAWLAKLSSCLTAGLIEPSVEESDLLNASALR